MKLISANKRMLILLLILAIILVYLYQYRVFAGRADSIQREHAESHMKIVYNRVVENLHHIYTESAQHDPTSYALILNDFSGISVATADEDTQTAIAIKNGANRGQLLPVEGAYYFTGYSISVGENLINYLSNCAFDPLYDRSGFKNSVESAKPAIAKYTDSKSGEQFYIYYAPTDFLNIEVFVVCASESVDGSLLSIRNGAKGFFFTELSLFIMLIIWLAFDRVYTEINSKRESEKFHSIQRRYKTALCNKNNFIWEYYLDTDTMQWDEANCVSEPLFDVSGQNRKQMISDGKVCPDDQWTFYQFCDDLVTDDPFVSAEFRIRDTSGEYRWYSFTGTKVFNEYDYPSSVIGQSVDIHDSKLETEKLREEASLDTLTKLYNYATFQDIVSSCIASTEDAEIMALILIDVDNFSEINSLYGFAFADALLVDIANRLRRVMPDGTVIGRFGGDEFVTFVRNIQSMSFVVDLAKSVQGTIQNAMSESKQKYGLSCSIGISLFPVDDMIYTNLFNKADMALYDAKQKGKGRYSIYDSRMQQVPESARTKNSIKLSLPSASSRDSKIVDSTILANAIDILFDSRDLTMSISIMLSIIGIYYKLDHIEIIELREAEGGTNARMINEWASEKSYKVPDTVMSSEYSADSFFRGYEADSAGSFLCDDVSELAASGVDLSSDIYLADAKALLQFGIKYRNKYSYVINVEMHEPRAWTKDELDSLSLLAKLIGSYLVQLRSQETLDFVSQMDALTGTYNLTAFLQRADKVLASDDNRQYAMIYADIQQFKLLNDTYGYASGDSILIGISDILQHTGGPNALLSRITGDRFVAMYPYENGAELQNKLRRILMEAKRIPQPNGEYYRFALTLGVYLIEAGNSAQLAVDRANIAMKSITDYHNTGFMFYDESMHENLIEQKDIEDTMEQALRDCEFHVYYQPKIHLATGDLIGSEALVRWVRDGKIVPPDKFIPVFEDNGFILQLDYYMLDKVCATMRKCLDEGLDVQPVSVNFSRVHLSNTALPSKIAATLKKYSVDPSLIEVEITESALNAGNTYQVRILNEIRALGCHLSMDDFGSGMSSLNVLRLLPFDILKLDKDFLHSTSDMTGREQIIIKSIVKLAKELDMKVICEGVETEEQARFLRTIGCNYGQGYLFSRPIPEQDFISKYYGG